MSVFNGLVQPLAMDFFCLAGAGGFRTQLRADGARKKNAYGILLAAHCVRARFLIAPTVTKQKSPTPLAMDFFVWQGQEDSNPRPTVLETGTLPAELYPCVYNAYIISHSRSKCKPFLKNLLDFCDFLCARWAGERKWHL